MGQGDPVNFGAAGTVTANSRDTINITAAAGKHLVFHDGAINASALGSSGGMSLLPNDGGTQIGHNHSGTRTINLWMHIPEGDGDIRFGDEGVQKIFVDDTFGVDVEVEETAGTDTPYAYQLTGQEVLDGTGVGESFNVGANGSVAGGSDNTVTVTAAAGETVAVHTGAISSSSLGTSGAATITGYDGTATVGNNHQGLNHEALWLHTADGADEDQRTGDFQTEMIMIDGTWGIQFHFQNSQSSTVNYAYAATGQRVK